MARPDAPVLLFNAMRTRDPVFVLDAEDNLVLLPQAPKPILLQSHSDTGSTGLPITVGPDSPALAQIRVLPEAKAIGILSVPERIDGVLYLVDPEALYEFPDRDDFVAPALWQWLPREGELEDTGDDALGRSFRDRTALVAVTRQPWAAATSDTRVITDDDWVEASAADDEAD